MDGIEKVLMTILNVIRWFGIPLIILSVWRFISSIVRGNKTETEEEEVPVWTKIREKRLEEAVGLLEQAQSIIEEVKDEEQDGYDNLPEGFQNGDRGDQMQSAIDSMETKYWPVLQVS